MNTYTYRCYVCSDAVKMDSDDPITPILCHVDLHNVNNALTTASQWPSSEDPDLLIDNVAIEAMRLGFLRGVVLDSGPSIHYEILEDVELSPEEEAEVTHQLAQLDKDGK